MTSLKKDVVGFFEEPTTYRHDFINYPLQSIEKPVEKCPSKNFNSTLDQNSISLPSTITSYDTLQKLDYSSRLPFDAMLRPKEIVRTHPRDTFCLRNITDKGLKEAIETRPRQYVSPGISLDNVKDPETRQLMIDFTYTTITGQAGKEAWSDLSRNEQPCLPNTVFEETVDPVALRLQLIPDIPAGFQSSARKWDRIQERYYVNTMEQFQKNRQYIDYEKRMADLISEEKKDQVRSLIKENKLRLPYDRMPLSYGGFRPQFAIEVPLEIKKSSPYDANLTVAKAISAYVK